MVRNAVLYVSSVQETGQPIPVSFLVRVFKTVDINKLSMNLSLSKLTTEEIDQEFRAIRSISTELHPGLDDYSVQEREIFEEAVRAAFLSEYARRKLTAPNPVL